MTLHQHHALSKHFSKWLSRRRGAVIKAEDFHQHMSRHGVEAADWQRTMSGLVNQARSGGRIRPCGLTRDRWGSWKAKWRVVA